MLSNLCITEHADYSIDTKFGRHGQNRETEREVRLLIWIFSFQILLSMKNVSSSFHLTIPPKVPSWIIASASLTLIFQFCTVSRQSWVTLAHRIRIRTRRSNKKRKSTNFSEGAISKHSKINGFSFSTRLNWQQSNCGKVIRGKTKHWRCTLLYFPELRRNDKIVRKTAHYWKKLSLKLIFLRDYVSELRHQDVTRHHFF